MKTFIKILLFLSCPIWVPCWCIGVICMDLWNEISKYVEKKYVRMSKKKSDKERQRKRLLYE